MCTGLEIALLAGTAISAGTAIYQGQKQQKIVNAQAQQAVNDAAYTKDEYQQKADKIRREGKTQVGETNAALAASGVKLGTGTPLELTKTIQQRSEQDALAAIVSGTRAVSAGNEQAGIYSASGRASSTAGYLKAGSTVLGAAIDYNRGGWKVA